MAARFSAEIEKGVESLIHCLICTEPYNDPRVLPCQHTFCRQCLTRYHENTNQQRIIKSSNFPCPSCRKTVYLAQGEIINLPKDFKVGQISDFFDKINISSKSDKDNVTCDICRYEDKQIQATSFCVQCSKYLCTKCTAHHGDSVIFKGHSTMKLDVPDVSVLECQEHNEEIKYYCRPCSAVLCTVCALGKHSKHDLLDITTALEQHRMSIQEYVDKLRTYITTYETKAEELAAIRKQKEAKVAENKTKVKQHVQDCIKKLQDEESRILSELDTSLCQAADQIKGEEANIQTTVNSIQSLCDTAEGLVQQDQSIQLLATSNTMQTRLKKMIDTPCPPISDDIKKHPCFTPNNNIRIGYIGSPEPEGAAAAGAVAGAVGGDDEPRTAGKHLSGIKLTIHTPVSLQRSSSTNSPEMRRRHRLGSCPPVSGGASSSSSSSPMCREGLKLLWQTMDNSETRDVAFFPDGSMVCSEHKLGTNKLQLYDVKGNVTKCMKSNGTSQLVKPWGLAINTQQCMIAVTDHGDSSIKFLDTELHISQTWRRLFEKPCGIAVMRSGEYVITDIGERYLQKISVYLANGIRIRDFGSKGSEEGQFLQPNYVAVDHHDRIVVSDSQLNCVKVLDRMGKQLFQFKSNNTNLPMIPMGLAIDAKNNIIVADQGCKAINMYSSDGKFMDKIIDVDTIPWGIGVHDTGLLGITTDPSLQVVQVPVFKRP